MQLWIRYRIKITDCVVSYRKSILSYAYASSRQFQPMLMYFQTDNLLHMPDVNVISIKHLCCVFSFIDSHASCHIVIYCFAIHVGFFLFPLWFLLHILRNLLPV